MDTCRVCAKCVLVVFVIISLCSGLPTSRHPGRHGNSITKDKHNTVTMDTDLRVRTGSQGGVNVAMDTTSVTKDRDDVAKDRDDVTKDKDDVTEDEDALWARIEHRVLHHLRRVEDGLRSHVDQKTSRLNQTVTINYLYKVYQYLIEEVEVGKRIGEMRAGEIEKVRKIALEQGKKIVAMETDLGALGAVISNLSAQVDHIRQHGVSRPAGRPDVTSSAPDTTTTYRPKPQLPADCQEVYQLGGMKYEGDYFIKINPYLTDTPFEACCRMKDNAGWTVIQRRLDGSVDFYRSWSEYKAGFGEPRGEFWMGNDRIYQLTNQDDYMLRIEMSDFDGGHHYAEYDHFRILDESHDYQMHVHGFHGDAGDSLTPSWNNHDGQPFSTYDSDHDDRYYDNCAERFHGAWWFKSCFESHLNGLYYQRGEHDNYFQQNGIQWNTVGHHYSLKAVTMMVKPNKQFTETQEHQQRMLSNHIQ